MRNYLTGVHAAFVLTLSCITNAHAALVDNGIHTLDTNTGLVWLDLSETFTDSYSDTYLATQTGGVFKSHRVATRTELETLFSNYLFDISLWNLWGNSGAPITGVYFDDPSFDEIATGTVYLGTILDNGLNTMNDGQAGRSIYEAGQGISTALVQVVPIPAAVWLLGSGILCLLGIARRKTA